MIFFITSTSSKIATFPSVISTRTSALLGPVSYTHLIRNTELLFDGLEAETDYAFKIRSVNKDGYSDWSSFNVKTKSNPLEFAIKGIRGEVTAEEQGGFEIFRLFDFAELGYMFHTKYRKNACLLYTSKIARVDREMARIQEIQGKIQEAILSYGNAAHLSQDTNFIELNTNDVNRLKNISNPVAQSPYIQRKDVYKRQDHVCAIRTIAK